MTDGRVREALEKMASHATPEEWDWLMVDIHDLAPKIEAALQATALEMRRRLGVEKAGDHLVEVCVTVGIAKLGEET